MTTEYWLQKKTIGGWSMVTSYTDLEQAQRNYLSCVGNGMSGYSWRLVEVKTIQEDMLNDVVDIPPAAIDAMLFGQSFVKDGKHIPAEDVIVNLPANSGWSRPADVLIQPAQDAPKSTGWGADTSGWGKSTSINPALNKPLSSVEPSSPSSAHSFYDKPEHGLTGSICLMHHGLKKRCRAMPDELDMLLSQGWQRGGPRTQFEV